MRRPVHQAAGTQEPACPLWRCGKRGSYTVTEEPAACVIRANLLQRRCRLYGAAWHAEKTRSLFASSALEAPVVVIGANAPIVAPTRAFAAASCGEGNQDHDLARARVSRGLLGVRRERDYLPASEPESVARCMGSDHVWLLPIRYFGSSFISLQAGLESLLQEQPRLPPHPYLQICRTQQATSSVH
ncbi:hypothetical protein MRX96_033426 [Rhipicephalus microplus]